MAFINPSLASRITVYCSYMYVYRELSKRVLLQTFQEESTWLNRLWGKQWSVIQRTSKYVTVTLDTDEERINLLYIQTYSWKEKLAVLMLHRFQGSLQRTKTLILKPGKKFTGIYGALYEGECVSYSPEYFQNFLNFKRSLVLKTQLADKFYYCFKLTDISTFYSCSSAVSNRCHNFKNVPSK